MSDNRDGSGKEGLFNADLWWYGTACYAGGGGGGDGRVVKLMGFAAVVWRVGVYSGEGKAVVDLKLVRGVGAVYLACPDILFKNLAACKVLRGHNKHTKNNGKKTWKCYVERYKADLLVK